MKYRSADIHLHSIIIALGCFYRMLTEIGRKVKLTGEEFAEFEQVSGAIFSKSISRLFICSG